MQALRGHFTAEGCTGVETFIASGNVLFTTRARSFEALTSRIESRLHRELGFEVHTFLRTPAEVVAIATARPFTPTAHRDATAYCVGFLAAPLPPAAIRRVLALRSRIDDFHVAGREVYWLCRTRQSDSTFSNAQLEKAIGARATFRSMTTMTRLVARYLVD
jgi:uncharacterized protein (DUF1697 family)